MSVRDSSGGGVWKVTVPLATSTVHGFCEGGESTAQGGCQQGSEGAMHLPRGGCTNRAGQLEEGVDRREEHELRRRRQR